MRSPCSALTASLMFPPMPLKCVLVRDFLCSVTIKKKTLYETASTLEHGIQGDLNLCSWAMATPTSF